jgi:hypothetical protein
VREIANEEVLNGWMDTKVKKEGEKKGKNDGRKEERKEGG